MNDPAPLADLNLASGPPPLPQAVFPPPPAPIPKRPAILTVFAILNIVVAGIGLLSLPFSLLMFYSPAGQGAGIMGDMVRGMPAYAAWIRVLLPPGAIVAGLQLYAGIRLLKGRESARKLAIACSLYGLGAAVVLGYLNVTYVMPYSMDNAMKQFPGGQADEILKNPGFVQMMRMMTQASAFMGIAIGMLPPLATLICLTRKTVRQYCQQQSS